MGNNLIIRATYLVITLSLFISLRSVASAASADVAVPLAIGETFVIQSAVLNEARRINIYIPPGYSENPNSKVPVIYMPDGGITEDFLHIAGLVEVLVNNGTMTQHLLVGIENTQRRRDMTGPTENQTDKNIAPIVGGSAEFRRFIREELKPAISRRYRVTDDSSIVGESLAGLFVIETFLVDPELFNDFIAIDPSLYWNDEWLVKNTGALLASRAHRKTKLYITSSSDGNPDTVRDFVNVLAKAAPAGVIWHYESMPEEKHSTIYHPAALKAFRKEFGTNTNINK